MEISPTTDVDMSDSTLSFLESVPGISSSKDESLLLTDSLNANSDFSASDMKSEEILPEDLLDIKIDKNDINLGSIGPISSSAAPFKSFATVQPQFTIVNSSGQQKSEVQSAPVCNFITAVSPAKTVELQTLKPNLSNSNKPNIPQFLILQKPTGNMPVLLSKNVSSSSNVTIVQPSTSVSSGTKILTLPALNTAGGILSAISPSGAGKTGDVKILLSGVPCATTFVASKPVVSTSTSNSGTSLQGPVKRAVAPSTGQMITKVIITNNAANNQTIISPAPTSVSGSTPIAVSQPQSILLASPNKTVTLPRNMLNITGSQQIIRTVPGTPPKQFVLSPVKPVQKSLGYTPVTYSKSPRRIAPATNTTVATLGTSNKLASPPTKLILKSVTQPLLKPQLVSANTSLGTATLTNIASATAAPSSQGIQPSSSSTVSVSQLQASGNKLHYVRLVSAATTTTVTSIVTKKEPQTLSATSLSSSTTNVSTVFTLSNASQVRPTVPIAPAKLVAPKQVGQKILIPAANSQVRTSTPATHVGQLPSGTLIPVAGNGSNNYVMLSTQYVTQLQQPSASSGTQMVNILPAPTPPSSSLGGQAAFISLSSNLPSSSFSANASSQSSHHSNRRVPIEIDSRQRKPCNCTKSQCLKLYCDCFANGEFCNSCNCNNCYNNLSHEEERQKAIKACLDRNPLAFHPKIGKSREGDHERRHTKGCNCKRSGCLKNYCECYEAKILCTNLCKCIGCKNFEDSSERKTLMHLADAAEVRVQQQIAAKTNLSSEILDIPSKPPVMSRTGERLPFAFVTDDVLEATCLCLLAHASDAEKSHSSEEEIEKVVLEEFGRCLKRIIDCANKTKVSKMDIP